MREQPDLGRTQLLDVCNTEFNWLSRHVPATARALLVLGHHVGAAGQATRDVGAFGPL
ncbi:MAG: hypothetical protein RI988_920 [Pseudomonadota bacterium]|jgi:hypothetical protein